MTTTKRDLGFLLLIFLGIAMAEPTLEKQFEQGLNEDERAFFIRFLEMITRKELVMNAQAKNDFVDGFLAGQQRFECPADASEVFKQAYMRGANTARLEKEICHG